MAPDAARSLRQLPTAIIASIVVIVCFHSSISVFETELEIINSSLISRCSLAGTCICVSKTCPSHNKRHQRMGCVGSDDIHWHVVRRESNEFAPLVRERSWVRVPPLAPYHVKPFPCVFPSPCDTLCHDTSYKLTVLFRASTAFLISLLSVFM